MSTTAGVPTTAELYGDMRELRAKVDGATKELKELESRVKSSIEGVEKRITKQFDQILQEVKDDYTHAREDIQGVQKSMGQSMNDLQTALYTALADQGKAFGDQITGLQKSLDDLQKERKEESSRRFKVVMWLAGGALSIITAGLFWIVKTIASLA